MKLVRYKHRANNITDPLKYDALEIDVKSDGNTIVLGHDYNEITCSLLEYLDNCLPTTELAINIKQSGLCDRLFSILDLFQLKSYFVFDMSFPDFLEYDEKHPENTAIRLSEFEDKQYLKFKSRWVWIDIFGNHKFFDQQLNILDKKLVVASPELHGSNYKYEKIIKDVYGMCTDDVKDMSSKGEH